LKHDSDKCRQNRAILDFFRDDAVMIRMILTSYLSFGICLSPEADEHNNSTRGIERTLNYCRRTAAQCAQRAEKTNDEDVREFFLRMRDNWLLVASGLEDVKNTERHSVFAKRHALNGSPVQLTQHSSLDLMP
jgi:hypothetical protein